MTREALKGALQGPITTVPTPFDDEFKLDLGVMADLTEWWVESGLVTGKSVIKVAAAMGEGPDLADDEWPHLLRTVVNAAKGKATIVCALKTKNTLHTIEDARKAADLGAFGLQIDLPLFHHPTQDDYVRFFTDISDAIEIGILIYNTWWFGALSITAQTMLRLADAERVVAIKWAVPPDGGIDYDEMRRFAGHVNVIDNSGDVVRCHRNGGRGYVSSTGHVYPEHDFEVWDLMEEHRYDEAQVLVDAVDKPLWAFMAKAAQRSGGYRTHKAMMEVVGHPVGPPRPPTLPLDAAELAALRELMISTGFPVPGTNRGPMTHTAGGGRR